MLVHKRRVYERLLGALTHGVDVKTLGQAAGMRYRAVLVFLPLPTIV